MNKKIKEKRSKKILNKRRKKLKRVKAMKLWIRRFNLIFLCLFVLSFFCFVIYFVLSKFLIVKNISVKGSNLYSDFEIINSSGIKVNDSILFLNTTQSEKNIFCSLAYAEKIRIKKQIPNKIEISVEDAEPLYLTEIEGQYVTVSKNGKLLEKRSEILPEIVCVISEDIFIDEDKKIGYKNSDTEKLIPEIIEAFKNKGLNLIKQINLSDKDNITVNYDERISILLGCSDDIDYKVLTAKEIISNKIGVNEKGVLDLKNLKQENRSYFYEN